MSQRIRIQIAPADNEDAEILADLIASSEEIFRETPTHPGVEPLAFDPLSWALLIGGVAALSAVVLDFLERRRGGMIVDRSVDPVQIKRSADVLPNTVLIILTDGNVRFEQISSGDSVAKKIFSEILNLTVGAKAADVKELITSKGGTASIEA